MADAENKKVKLTDEQKRKKEKDIKQKRENEKRRRDYFDYYDDVKTSIKQDW